MKGASSLETSPNTTLGSSVLLSWKPCHPPGRPLVLHVSCHVFDVRSLRSSRDEAPGGAGASGREEARSSTCRKGPRNQEGGHVAVVLLRHASLPPRERVNRRCGSAGAGHAAGVTATVLQLSRVSHLTLNENCCEDIRPHGLPQRASHFLPAPAVDHALQRPPVPLNLL